MKELSLNILDIAQNSVKARAKNILIKIDETEETLTLTIADDGCGMGAETVERVMDPFYTTRTTRSVGLGIPLLKLAAEQTGGGAFLRCRDGGCAACRRVDRTLPRGVRPGRAVCGGLPQRGGAHHRRQAALFVEG